MTPHDGCRVSPFGHPRIKACSAAPRGFSQLTTSFIGSRRLGIHRWLFVAWKNKDARARYAVLKGLWARLGEPNLEAHDNAPAGGEGVGGAHLQNGTEDGTIRAGWPRRGKTSIDDQTAIRTQLANASTWESVDRCDPR